MVVKKTVTLTPVSRPIGAEPWRTLDPNGRRARYGVSYVRNLAAQAGVSLMETSPDEDTVAVDCYLDFGDSIARVQVKCTHGAKAGGGPPGYAAQSRWVDRWTRSLNPIYFVVVQVQPDSAHWIGHDPAQTVHHTRAFWKRLNLSDLGSTITVPDTQRLTAETFEIWHAHVLESHGGAP